MSLRIKLFLLPALAIAAAAALVAWGSVQYVRRQSEQAGEQRTRTLAAQFQREMKQRGEEVVRTVQSLADAESMLRMALDLTRTQADPSIYANDARGLSKLYHLDFLELTTADGSLISASTWAPASGYRNDWVAGGTDWTHQGAFLSRVQLPDKVELGLLAVRAVRVGDRNLYVIGGSRFDRAFLQTLAVPEGMSALLYANLEPRFIPEALTGSEGPVAQSEEFAPIIESLQRGENPQPRTISSFDQASSAQTFVAVPLPGRGGERLGALLIGSSQQDLATMVKYIRSLALLAGGLGVLLSLALSWWISAGVSRPLAQATNATREPQSGKPAGQQGQRPRGEGAPAAAALSDVSGQSSRERERLLQRERVATRREMARRFARDLKESIFPLHMATEDMVNAREETSERFEEIFFESATSIRAELDRLKSAAARFGEFGRVSRPRPVPVSVNEIAQGALKAIEPQFRAAGRPPVTPEVHWSETDPVIEADPDQLRAALENLFLHYLDAIPSGGTLAIRTREKNSLVSIEIFAQGASLNAEDCQRLFVPSGAAPEGMTGLGLATAEAFVSDHGGRISAESVPGGGTTIRLEFSCSSAGASRSTQTGPAPLTQPAIARPTQAEAARQTSPQISEPARPGATTQPHQMFPVAAVPAEPVPVAVGTAGTGTTSDETPAALETSVQSEQPSNPARSRRGLTFTA